MRPLRIDMKEYREFSKFSKVVTDIFGITDEPRIKAFYDDMFSRYLQIILDIDTGEVLQAFTTEGYWILTKQYLDMAQTPTDIYTGKPAAYIPPTGTDRTAYHNSPDATKLKQIAVEETKAKIEIILKKIEEEGADTLTRKEVKFLRENSNLI
jgi:hypothetical protein